MKVTRAERREQHREKMQRKKIERRARKAGFTPVPNARIDAAISAQTVLLMKVRGLNPDEAASEARRIVAGTLPPPRMVRRMVVRPSRSDSAAYRNGAR